MNEKEEKLHTILTELQQNSEVTSSAIVSSKGQLMASALRSDLDGRAIAAMSAALESVGGRVSSTLSAGKIDSIVVNGDKQLIFLQGMTSAMLVALAPSDAKLGLIDFEVSNALDKIKLILD